MNQGLANTLVKVGRYDFPLEYAVKKFGEILHPVKFGLGNTIKYSIFKESLKPYLLMVSQQKERKVNSAGYNTMLTVTSRSDKKNLEIASQFERETGIRLDIDVPEQIKRNTMMMNMSFQVFEKKPEAAMDILKNML